MILLGLVGGYVTLFAAGFGVVLLIKRDSTQVNLIECSCLAWLLGVGVVSLLLWLAGIFVSGFTLQLLVAAACVVFGIVAWRIKQSRKLHFSMPRPNGRLEWSLAGLLTIELVLIFVVCLKHTLGWDGLINWELKARYAFLNSGIVPQAYYSSPGRAFSHPEYPLAIPFTELWLYLWMGAPHQFWIKTIFPFFYIAGVLLIALLVARLTAKRWVGLLVALLIPFVPFVTASPGGVIVGYADIPIAICYAAALGYLLCSLEGDSRPALTAYAGLLTLIPWIKSEGLVLWLFLAVTGLVVALDRHQVRLFTIAVVPGLMVIAGWRIYLKAMQAVPPPDFARPGFELLKTNLNRLGAMSNIFWAEITDTSHWSIYWLLVLVAVIYLLLARRLSKLLLVIGVLGPIILYWFTYVFSNWPSYTAHMTSSFPRLLLHVMPAGWLAIGLALAPSKSEIGKLES